MIGDLYKKFSALPQVEAIALGGSRAGKNWDEKSDFDVYLYVTAAVDEETRRAILSPLCSRLEIGNSFWEYEDNCTLKNGLDADILYRNLDAFTEGVARVVEGYNASNGYTTCMWHNLKTCKIIYDRTGRLTAVKKRFDVPYPEELKRNIIVRNMRLLHTAMPAYDAQIAKAVRRGDTVSVNHRTAAFMESYFDVIFALNGLTHPGEKKLVRLCRESCALLPKSFEENIERLFNRLFSDGAGALEILRKMIAALTEIIPADMLPSPCTMDKDGNN